MEDATLENNKSVTPFIDPGFHAVALMVLSLYLPWDYPSGQCWISRYKFETDSIPVGFELVVVLRLGALDG